VVSSAKAFKDDGKASKSAKKSKEGEAKDNDVKAQKISSKMAKSKAGKMFKSKKGHATPAPPEADEPITTPAPPEEEEDYDDPANYRSEYFNPSYWHPKTRNFEIIDWDRWERECGDKVPFNTDQPRRAGFSGNIFQGASPWGRLDNIPEEQIATGAKPSVGFASDPDYGLFYGILGQAPDPSLVPEPFLNKLLWMQDNVAPEYMNSFNRAAWRENTEEGRATGLFCLGDDYSMATSTASFTASKYFKDKFVNFQVSPSGKWIKFFSINADPDDPELDGMWFDMYIVQEGDEFTDRDGNVLDWVKAGDIFRIEFDENLDPYACNYTTYEYFMRVVATIDEETGVITPNQPHYDAMMDAVLTEPPKELREASKNFTDSSFMTGPEKWDFLADYEPDRQLYLSAPRPPPAHLLNNLEDDSDF